MFGILAAAGQAVGQSVQIELRDSGGALVGSAQNFASGAAISLGTIPTNVDRVNVFSVGGNASVGTISLDADQRSTRLDVFLGNGAFPVADDDVLPVVAANWAGLDVSAATQSKLRVAAGISGNITGPVRAATITRLQVGGTINAEIDASGELGAAADIGVIVAGSVGVDGDIGAGSPGNPGFIGSVTTTTGDLLGDVIATSEIGDVLASHGTLGNATTRVAIKAVDGIDSVVAEAINADVVANDAGGEGGLGEIRSTQGGMIGSLRAADVIGPLPTEEIIMLAGDSAVDVEISRLNGKMAIEGDNLGADSKIKIGQLSGQVRLAGDASTIHVDFMNGWTGPSAQGSGSVIATLGSIDRLFVGGVLQQSGGEIKAPFIGRLELIDFAGLITSTDPFQGATVGMLRARSFSGPESADYIAGCTNCSLIDLQAVGDMQVSGAWPTTDAASERVIIFVRQTSPTTRIEMGSDCAASWRLAGEDPAGFKGQLTVNALPGLGLFYTGQFNTLISSQQYTGYYNEGIILPDSLGAGAIGSPPFNVAIDESDARNVLPATGWPTETQFNSSTACTTTQLRGIQIDMYGPVRIQNPALPAFKVERNFGGTWVDLSPRVVFETREAVAGAGFDRIVVLRGKENYGLPRGTYRVTPTSYEVNGVGNLVCDQLLTTALVPVSSDLEYTFTLQPDCNTNCIADASEPGPVTCNPVPICDPIDFNNDAVFPDDQDLIDYMNVTAGGGCSAGNTCNDIDFNNDGVFPDEQDVIDFFNVLAGAECSNMV